MCRVSSDGHRGIRGGRIGSEAHEKYQNSFILTVTRRGGAQVLDQGEKNREDRIDAESR